MMELGLLFQPWSEPSCHSLVLYRSGCAMPKRARAATLKATSTAKSPYMTDLGVRHLRGMAEKREEKAIVGMSISRKRYRPMSKWMDCLSLRWNPAMIRSQGESCQEERGRYTRPAAQARAWNGAWKVFHQLDHGLERQWPG